METNYFEELVEFYNSLLEDTRWKQAVRAGELSGKAISTLRKKNIIPKQRRMLRGMETGTKNILKKSGATHTNVDVDSSAAAGALKKSGLVNKRSRKKTIRKIKRNELNSGLFITISPDGKKIRTFSPAKTNNKQNKFSHAVANRHEADEAKQLRKTIDRINQKKQMAVHPISTAHRSSPQLFGAHMSPTILSREKKSRDFLKHAYGKGTEAGKSNRQLERLRKNTIVSTVGKSEETVASDKKLQDKIRRRFNRQDRRAAKSARKKAAANENITNIINNFLLQEFSR
jgi:hypothetical protein